MVLIGPSPSGTKAAKTANMITAAATTTRDDVTKPSSIDRSASPLAPCVVVRAAGVQGVVPLLFTRCTYASRIRETRKTS